MKNRSFLFSLLVVIAIPILLIFKGGSAIPGGAELSGLVYPIMYSLGAILFLPFLIPFIFKFIWKYENKGVQFQFSQHKKEVLTLIAASLITPFSGLFFIMSLGSIGKTVYDQKTGLDIASFHPEVELVNVRLAPMVKLNDLKDETRGYGVLETEFKTRNSSKKLNMVTFHLSFMNHGATYDEKLATQRDELGPYHYLGSLFINLEPDWKTETRQYLIEGDYLSCNKITNLELVIQFEYDHEHKKTYHFPMSQSLTDQVKALKTEFEQKVSSGALPKASCSS